MRALVGGLAAVALLGVIVLTALEVAPRVDQLRGGNQGGAPAATDDLAELAARLIAPPYPMPDGSAQTATLYPGKLPPSQAFELPIPAGAHLVGSVLRQRTGANPSYDVVIDVAGKPDDITAFYERELGKKGLTAPPMPPMPQPGGFVGSVASTTGKMFCAGEEFPYVSLTVFPRLNAANDVRLHFEPAQKATGQFMKSPCMKQGMGPGAMPASKLPTLRAPDGVFLQGGMGGSMGGGRQSSEAMATTSKTAAELETFFAQQLVAAGWTRVAGAANAPLAFSTWKVPGEGDWTGLLIVVETPTKDRRSLMLRAESPTAF